MQNQQEIQYSKILNSKSYSEYQNGNILTGIDLFNKIILKKPNDSNLWVELGNAHLKNIDFKMAKLCFDTALDLNPYNPNAICAVGLYFFELGLFDKAKDYFIKTLEISPNSEWGLLNLSLTEQKLGNYTDGLKLYEKREKIRSLLLHENLNLKDLPELSTLKKSYVNKKVLIIGEQGFGDQLMACLYIKKLVTIGLDITYLVNEKLFDLLINVNDLKDIRIVKEITKDKSKIYDFKIFSMSLPLLFKQNRLQRSNVIIKQNSIKNDVKNTELLKNLSSKNKLNVGIAWSGRPTQTRNSFRSLNIELLNEIVSDEEINFFSLQKLSSKSDREFFKNYDNFYNCEDYLNNFQDTSFFVSKMDFIISVCTSLVHLSGLMRKKTLLLLSYVHDSRWDKGENGYLYPNLHIIKQKKLNNWGNCITKVKNQLNDLKHIRRKKC